MRNLIKKRPNEPSWVTWIKKRIKNNLNFIALAEGPTGSGKSWGMISLAHMIDPTFEPRQIAFSFKQVMEILNADWFYEKDWRIIVFDEAQTDIGNRQWQSLTNKLMNYLLSTFRHRNVILLFTSPYSDFLDSHSMKLLHAKFEMRGWNKKTKRSRIRPKIIQYNANLKKFYYHSLFTIVNGKSVKLTKWLVPPPPQSIITPYEDAKLAFTQKLNREILAELTANEEKGKTTKPLTELQEKIAECWEKGITKQVDIAQILGKDRTQITRNVGFMRNKGYTPNVMGSDNTRTASTQVVRGPNQQSKQGG